MTIISKLSARSSLVQAAACSLSAKAECDFKDSGYYSTGTFTLQIYAKRNNTIFQTGDLLGVHQYCKFV